MTPNRIVALAASLLGAAILLSGLLADLGAAPQAVAIAAGAVTFLTPVVVWLRGWQAWEARQGEADQPVGWEDVREQLERLLAHRPAQATAPDEPAPVGAPITDSAGLEAAMEHLAASPALADEAVPVEGSLGEVAAEERGNP